ncbi:MAG: 30S ribosomal protein S3 [Pseudomonadota bacterium]
MGQKVHPIGFRLGYIKTWDSKWFSIKNYSEFICQDRAIRQLLRAKLANASLAKIEIERAAKRIKIRIYTARPGLVIGKKGAEIEALKQDLAKIVPFEVMIDIHEIRKPEIDAQLVSEAVARQLVRRIAFRRAMKKAVASAMRFGAGGIKITCSGRLGGAEMGRREWYREGRVPLHTLRADIDCGFSEANTTYGIIGVKVLIFKGEIIGKQETENATGA